MENKQHAKKANKKLGRAMVVMAMVIALMVNLFPLKVREAQAASEVIGYGTLNASWVNLGLNWNMTGGTSGKVVRGESFVVYEKKNVNGTNRYYVYAENADIYGYISERFINYTPFSGDKDEIIGYGKLNASWVNLGLNWEMTGGTSGRVVSGETFLVYAKKNVNGTNRYYVYAEKAGIYGYISERFITVLEAEDAGVEDENRIALDVALHVQETTTTCGVASVKMVLDYLGVKNSSGQRISESTLWKWANSNGEGTYVYRIAQTLTKYGVAYKYLNMSDAVSDDYWDELEKSLKNDRPVIIPIKPTKNSYWDYNTGHYIVVTGVYTDGDGDKQVIINDCHYKYSAEDKVVPLKELVRVSKNHSAYIIVGK
ncbi:MAG: C39 family peptidase [Lachnospiraceae bacterium]|nr:C39 family peptidase [Lachnospiraceae bacterium]